MAVLGRAEDEAATGGYVGLANQGATCYLNSLLQTLFMTPEFTRELFRWRLDGQTSAEARTRSIPHQLQMLFARLLTSECRAISTVDLTKSFHWDSDQAFVQHDVQELCRLLFDALEEAFAGTVDVTRLFRGQLVDFLTCKPPHTHTSSRSDAFLDLQLAVRTFGSDRPIASVLEGLRNFLQPESLDGTNQYELAPGRKVDAWKGLRLAELPPLLTVHLKRFAIDYTTMRNLKINDRVEFGQTLCFVKKGTDETEATHHDAEGWRPVDLPELQAEEHAANTTELLEYELYSVLVHSGTATSGHYFAYIKDLSRSCWLKFDDSTVTVASWADVETTFGESAATATLLEPSGGTSMGYGGLFGSSSTVPPVGPRSTTAYMLTYRRKRSPNANPNAVRFGLHDAQSDMAAPATDAADGIFYTPGGTDPLDPLAVVVPPFLKQALQEDAAAKADAEAARVERENHLEIAVHCNRELLQQLQLPWDPPEQVIVSFRRGNTAGMLLEKVSQTLQKLCPEAADNTSVGRSLLLSADTAQVCLLDVKENIVRLRWSADSPLDPKALLDSRRGGSTPFVYFLDQAPKGDREGGGWFFGDGDPPCTELAVLNPKDRPVSATLLHATSDGIVCRCDVTLGQHPSESQVWRAASSCFDLEPQSAVRIFRGQSMLDKDFAPMPTSTVAAGGHSWEGLKWEAHPYLAVTTSVDQDGEKAGDWKWMKSAVSHAMTVRILFTELGESDEGDKEYRQNSIEDAREKGDKFPDLPGCGSSSGSVFTTRSLLFDARQRTDELKNAIAAVLNQTPIVPSTCKSKPLRQQTIDPSNFNALLKIGTKETVLNRPTSQPFQLARFRSGFSRLPCCISLKLVNGRAADARTRTLALRWHIPGGPGVALWTETVNAAELSLQGCKQWLLDRLCAEENATRLPTAARDEVSAARKLLQENQHQQLGLRLRLYATVGTQLQPGKVLTTALQSSGESGNKLSEFIPPSDVAVPVAVSLLTAVPVIGADGVFGSAAETATNLTVLPAHKMAGSLACEHNLAKGGHALVVLYRWLAASAGELGPATELVVEASTSAASVCEAIVKAVATKGDIAAEHIELVRHWPRGAVVGPTQVIGKSWSRRDFDATVLSGASGQSHIASPGKRRRLDEVEDGDGQEGCVIDDIFRDGDVLYWRDSRESATSTFSNNGNIGNCENQPKTKKARQQSILSLFGGTRKSAQQQGKVSLK